MINKTSKEEVKALQQQLNFVLQTNLIEDGIWGAKTLAAWNRYQVAKYGRVHTRYEVPLAPAQLATLYKLKNQYNYTIHAFQEPRFVAFIDAGHGGISPQGNYTTKGKRAFHSESPLHNLGHYYEGVENRIIAEAVIQNCTALGIECIRTYHPFKDWHLGVRTELIRSHLQAGVCGYLHSFHSNAISNSYSQTKKDNTRGFMAFTTIGNTLSDQIASQHYKHARETTQEAWQYREQNKDGDPDYEANFQVLRETDLNQFPLFAAVLEEWGFHTSLPDVEYITSPKGRTARVRAAVKTIQFAKELFQKEKNKTTRS